MKCDNIRKCSGKTGCSMHSIIPYELIIKVQNVEPQMHTTGKYKETSINLFFMLLYLEQK